MKVRDLPTPEVVSIRADASVLDAARAMRERHVGSVVVVDERLSGRIPLGMLTDRDIVVGVVAQGVADLGSIRAGDVMNRELIVCRADEDVLDAMARMRQ